MQNTVLNVNPPRRGGRPPSEQVNLIGERILDVATDLFLTEGYGATSIEALAKKTGISKRTFYHRYKNKEDLFGAVVHRLIERVRPSNALPLFKGGTLEEILLRVAKMILRVTLSPPTLALHRLMVSEAGRFPELAVIMDREGSRREGVKLIAALLEQHVHPDNASFAAEQFLQMVVSIPQRRALGLGTPMNSAELDEWAEESVHLFLNGCRGLPVPSAG